MLMGEKIRACRIESKMTQKDLADILGISARSLINYEQDKRHPNPATIYQLTAVFNKSADYFLTNSKTEDDFSNPAAKNKAKILLAAISGLFTGNDLNDLDRDTFFKEIADIYFKSKKVYHIKL